MLIEIVRGLKIKNSLMRIDFIKNIKGEIYIIELSPRPSGLMISTRLVPLATGRNLIKEFLFLIQGKTVPEFKYKKTSAALCYLVFPNAKNIRIPSMQEILLHEGVIEYQLAEIDYSAVTIKNMSDILGSGFLLLKAVNETSCKNIYENLTKKFIIK